MTEIDWAVIKDAFVAPEITIDVYQQMPEEVSKMIEVVDGLLVRCESAEPAHQLIAHNFVNVLHEAMKAHDRKDGSCHRVVPDVDVLMAEMPRFHFRRPDVTVYRCIDQDRGKWRRKPHASDCLLVLEIVSADSVTVDIRDKLAEYAAAGIPHYWIVRMDRNDGPAISVDRFELAAGGQYVTAGRTIRGVDFDAVNATRPFPLTTSWNELDEGL
jgi:Uma2 family endonuclease